MASGEGEAVMRALPLRDYQARTIKSLYADYEQGFTRLATVLPTGGGKTVVFSQAAVDCVSAGRGVLVLAHRTELIEQAHEELLASSEGLDVGVMQARHRQYDRQVVVGSVQTVARPGALALMKRRGFGLVIVDECHHSAARSYQNIFNELGVFEQGGPLLYGVTATLNRADGLALGDTFEKVSETVEMSELIDAGYLLRPRGVRVKVEGLDFSAVRRSRTSESGLDDRAVARAMSDSLAPAAIARAVLEHGKGRKGVAFLPSVELSKEQARVFNEHGLRSVHIDADTPRAVRKELMRKARLGEYDMVCNVGLFTEGTNVPIWDLAVLGRPTSSEVLFTQMAGRPMRPYPGQNDCLILDVVGVTGRHRLRSLVDLSGAELPDELTDELKQFDEDELDEAPPQRDRDAEPVDTPQGVDGTLTHELIDLFSTSHVAWLRSPAGVWYLPAQGGRAVALVPTHEPDVYDVRWSDGEAVHPTPCDLSAAMAWGEAAVKANAPEPLTRRLTRAERLQAAYFGGGGAPFDPSVIDRMAQTTSQPIM